MLFKEMTSQLLIEKLQAQKATCVPMWGTVFYMIIPDQEKGMDLKNKFKPPGARIGLATDYLQQLSADPSVVQKANDKMKQAQFDGDSYDNSEGALKLHLSLNNIGEVDETVLLGLMDLLKKEAEDPNNNLSFYFKIIGPKMHDHSRFKMNDQLTLYFDKYSSVGDMQLLAKKIDEYLQKHIPQNKQALGPKDHLGLNSFVSARFDTNKLLKRYDIHPFFDLQLKKFINKHTPEQLKDLPICGLEAVFNTIITSPDITFNNKDDLSEADSMKAQAEFEKMLEDPAAYMNAHLKPAKPEVEQAKEKGVLGKIEAYFKGAREIDIDFDLSQDLTTLNSKIALIKAQFDKITNDPNLEKDFKLVDAKVFTQFGELMREKEKAFNDIIEQVMKQSKEISAVDLMRNKQRPLTLTQDHRLPKPELNPKAAKSFEDLLKNLYDKSTRLGSNEKGLCARKLHHTLDNAYDGYKAGLSSYAEFTEECDTAIKDSRPILEKHRGFREILVNLWEAIKSFGKSIYQEYKNSAGKHYFFKVPTESGELADKLDEAIKGGFEDKPSK